MTTARTSGSILADLSNPGHPTERRIASVRAAADLGRPALRGGRLAWHRVVHGGSAVYVLNLATDERRAIKRTNIWMEANPSVTAQRIVWVEHRPAGLLPANAPVRKQADEDADALKGRKTLPLDDRSHGPHGLCDEMDPFAEDRSFCGLFLI